MSTLQKVTREFVRRRSNLALSNGGRSALPGNGGYFRHQADCTGFALTSRIWSRKEQRHSVYQPLLLPLSLLLLVQGYASDLSTGCDGDDAGNDAKSEPMVSSGTKPSPQIDEDCPFCRFFLDGPCREAFIQWHACIQTSEKPTDCMDPFRPLRKCMHENEISFGGDESKDDSDDSDDSGTSDPDD